MVVLGMTSCNDELAQPPVVLPEGGIGTGAWNNPMTAYQVSLGVTNPALATPWVKGYIVGYINTGVSNVLSASSAAFTTPCTVNTNLLIASSADETDWTKCATVQLPSGAARNALNLKDNPSNLGKLVTIKGTVGAKYCGAYGVKSVSEFNWGDEGIDDGSDQPLLPEVEPAGEGTLESPYNVAKALQVCAANGSASTTQVYTEGYITNIKEVDTGTYGNATFSIADEPDGNTTLLVYHIYDLGNQKFTDANKIKVGDKVVIYTALINYNGNTLETSKGYIYSINGTTAEGGDTPSQPTGDTIYEGLLATSTTTDWTFDNVVMSEPLTYIWSWKDYNGSYYLNAGAYVDKQAYASEAYAISPVISLEGYKSVSYTFEHAAKFQTTIKTYCAAVVREEGATEWTALTIPTWPEAGSWTFVNAGNIDLSAYAGKKVQLGFKYGSSTEGADTWEIKNLVVTGTK